MIRNVSKRIDRMLGIENFNSRQLTIGTKIEMEHTREPLIATQIAKDHLREFPNYYTELVKMENRLKHMKR